MQTKSFFVFRPRTADDLSLDNPTGQWKRYQVVKTICLSRIDFENFETDLLADRQFIENGSVFCTRPGDCLLVTSRRGQSELLIMPWHGGFVRYAALRRSIHIL